MRDRLNDVLLSFIFFKTRHPNLVMSLLMFLIIPVASSLILGYEMRTDVASRIPTVVINNDNSDFSRTFLDYVNESETFDIISYVDNYEEAEDMMFHDKAFAAVVIPENFYSDLQNGKSPVILTLFDGAQMSVVTYSKNAMTEILMTLKAAYMMNIFEGKQSVVPEQVMHQVMPITTVTRLLYSPTRSLRNFLLPGMLAGIVQVALAISGAEAGFKKQKTRIPFYMHSLPILHWSIVGTASMLLTLGVQWWLFGMPHRGDMPGFVIFTFLYSLTIVGLGYCIGSIFPDRAFCSQASCILVLPTTILGGYTWPLIAMPPAIQAVARCLPFTYYGDTVRNVFFKPLQFHHMADEMFFMVKFFVIELVLLALIKLWKQGLHGSRVTALNGSAGADTKAAGVGTAENDKTEVMQS
ncbi:MAG: ABC transporter permease [Clostridia bacterium]|nr:ABC transporter permease [Clostridia bacterium]